MYRSSTGKFFLSLTPFDSFEDELLKYSQYMMSIENEKYYCFDNSDIENISIIIQKLFKPPICYSEYNKFLKFIISQLFKIIKNNRFEFLPYKIPYCSGINFNRILDIYNGIIQKDKTIVEEQKFIGICLYKVNLNDFKITEYKYIHTLGLLYDILNSYENCNYFIKMFDSNQIIYTFVDKLIINSFIRTLSSYMVCPLQITYYKMMYTISIVLYYLLSYQLYETLPYKRITNDFESIRNEFKNIRTTKILQINRVIHQKNHNVLSPFLISLLCLENENYVSVLKHFVSNSNNIPSTNYEKRKVFKSVKYESNNFVLEKYKLMYNRKRYHDFIIYEKDISYYIYDWWVLIYKFITYCEENNLPLIETKNSPTNDTLFFNELKNYEKSKYFFMKDNFNDKIFNNGISF